MRRLLAILLLAIPAAARAQDSRWTIISAKGASRTVRVDYHSAVLDESRVTLWVNIDYGETVTLSGGADSSRKAIHARTSVAKTQIDCPRQRMRALVTYDYDSAGAVTNAFTSDTEEFARLGVSGWIEAVPETLGENIVQSACRHFRLLPP